MKTKITEGLTMIMKKKELERQQGRTKEVANNDEIAMMEKARKENEGDVMGLGNIFIVNHWFIYVIGVLHLAGKRCAPLMLRLAGHSIGTFGKCTKTGGPFETIIFEASKNIVSERNLNFEQVESCLSRVEQSPVDSMENALCPSLKALIADKLLSHSDDDVKVTVASCISEITRITAPEAPYDDAQIYE
ncbi:hypothetical protein D0Y65_009183 [Glycine soja]|uniref:Uncharacterized protein n=1 Tax=Glycine soja TaxID=3848 RepID=A0A445KYD7_GLYSO|nr:hypothetical protein D0Y65_009183 [Glycine soja]